MTEDHISLELDHKAVFALSSAVDYTLKKWCGEEKIDQETLISLKYLLKGACFELIYQKDS